MAGNDVLQVGCGATKPNFLMYGLWGDLHSIARSTAADALLLLHSFVHAC